MTQRISQFWGQVSEFQSNFVSANQDVRRSILAITCVVVWALVAVVAALYACPKISRYGKH